jgi:HPr kinase/phosphorylase
VQVIGLTEVSYLRSLDQTEMKRRLLRTFEFDIPCFIVTTQLTPPPLLLELAREKRIPILLTSLPTSRFWAKLSFYLEHEFAPTEVLHSSMLDVFGLGVLIIGKSGIGKSECALELIERGHRLIADDSVVLKRLGRQVVTGSAAASVAHHMEVRGIGIVDVEKLFGVGSVREEQRVSLVVELERWEEGKSYDRTGLEERTFTVLDVELPLFIIPVEPGRNISLLVEVAALTQRLRNQGHNPAAELNRRLIERIQSRGGARPQIGILGPVVPEPEAYTQAQFETE